MTPAVQTTYGETIADPKPTGRRLETALVRRVEEALAEYEAEVTASRLKPSSKRTYLLHARHFVRWLGGDFEPGGSL